MGSLCQFESKPDQEVHPPAAVPCPLPIDVFAAEVGLRKAEDQHKALVPAPPPTGPPERRSSRQSLDTVSRDAGMVRELNLFMKMTQPKQ